MWKKLTTIEMINQLNENIDLERRCHIKKKFDVEELITRHEPADKFNIQNNYCFRSDRLTENRGEQQY